MNPEFVLNQIEKYKKEHESKLSQLKEKCEYYLSINEFRCLNEDAEKANIESRVFNGLDFIHMKLQKRTSDLAEFSRVLLEFQKQQNESIIMHSTTPSAVLASSVIKYRIISSIIAKSQE